MRTRVFLPLLAVFAASLGFSVSASAQGLLPAALGEWRSGELRSVRPAQAEQFAGADAGLLREFGLLQAEQRVYSRGSGSLAVTLYRMRDTSGAYGARDFLAAAASGGTSGTRSVILLGQFVLQADGPRGALESALPALTKPLVSSLDAAPYPTLLNYLPAENRLRGSERYLLGATALQRVLPLVGGDWAGFSAGAEAEFALYRVYGHEVPLLVASFPTPQIAAAWEKQLAQWFDVNGAGDAQRKAVAVRRVSSLLAIAPGDAATAEPILAGVHLDQILTFNEPGHHATQHPVAWYIYSIFVATGFILAFAFVAGLAFGGVRVLVKRLLPGKIFDRDEVVEILQLGLSSKPIDAKDFY